MPGRSTRRNSKPSAGQQDLEGACYRVVQPLARNMPRKSNAVTPKILRRVGGYNLEVYSRRRASGGRKPADGQPVDLGQPPLACTSAAPFILAPLFVGSEGTLGITLEAKLRLIELPKVKAVLVVQFAELLDALAATPAILAHAPSAVEVLDRYILASTRLNPEAARLRRLSFRASRELFCSSSFMASRRPTCRRAGSALEAGLRRLGHGVAFLRATDPVPRRGSGSCASWPWAVDGRERRRQGHSFVEDTAVAPEHLRDYIAEFLGVVARHGTTAGVYAHASVGCLHVRPVINLKTEEGFDSSRRSRRRWPTSC